MSKKTTLIKSFNKLLLSVNTRIESFFNKIKDLINIKKKNKSELKNIDKILLISFGSVVISLVVYFLIPTFYNKDSVKTKIENQLIEKYNLEVKFSKSIKYGLFPKPHYSIINPIVIYDKEELAKASSIKVFISIKSYS